MAAGQILLRNSLIFNELQRQKKSNKYLDRAAAARLRIANRQIANSKYENNKYGNNIHE